MSAPSASQVVFDSPLGKRCSGCGHTIEVHDAKGFCWVSGCECTLHGTYTPPTPSGMRMFKGPSRLGLER